MVSYNLKIHLRKNYKIGLIKEQNITSHINFGNVKTLNKWIKPCVPKLIHPLMNELHKNMKAWLYFIRAYSWSVV